MTNSLIYANREVFVACPEHESEVFGPGAGTNVGRTSIACGICRLESELYALLDTASRPAPPQGS